MKFQHKPGYNIITNNGAYKRNYRHEYDEGEFFAESLEFEGENQTTTSTQKQNQPAGPVKSDLRTANIGFNKAYVSYKRKPYNKKN